MLEIQNFNETFIVIYIYIRKVSRDLFALFVRNFVLNIEILDK